MEPIAIRRKRPFMPKTRTGCLTCKIRKVKCDEAKPACRRCTSTGRKCDGYVPVSTGSRSTSDSPSSRQSSPGRTPLAELFVSEAEKRSFSYFEARACHDISGSFHGLFWTREILQAAVHYPSTRHLVVAIGAAYEGFQSDDNQTFGPREPTDIMRLSFEQSNHSIRLMGALFDAARTGVQSLETTSNILTASLLFANLACLQGQVKQAIEHARSGLKVLQSFEKAQLRREATDTFPVSIAQLRSLLTSIYGQSRCMINDEALVQWEQDPLVSQIQPVVNFASLSEAHSYVEDLWHSLLAFLQQSELNPPNTPDEVARFNAHRELFGLALNSSREALEVLAARQSPDVDDKDSHGFTILRLYHTLIGIRIGINPLEPGLRESAFDNFQTDLTQMLQYCEMIVQGKQQQQQGPSFSTGLGYVMPLHMIAARCRDPRIRRRAVNLLLGARRREGPWDSVRTGKIVMTTMQREERVGDLQTIPSDARVREVKVEFLSERKLRVRYITVADWNARLNGEEDVVEW